MRIRKTLEPFLPARDPQHDHRKNQTKPTWRGRQHAIAFLASIPAGATLVAVAPTGKRWPAALYAATLTTTLGVSAAYHTLAKTPKTQKIMSRVDRATIYTLIAGTTTPVIEYTTPGKTGNLLLAGTWTSAALGAGARAAGKANTAATIGYVALGWAGAVGARNAWNSSKTAVALLAIGGVAYTSGAVIYASGWPNFKPETYGHHEAFHTLTLVGFATHYAAVAILTVKARNAGQLPSTPI